MTNYEHYEKEIVNIVRLGRMVAVERETGKVTSCNRIECHECKFYDLKDCDTSVFAWANEEYIEPGIDWSKVPVDTPILVSDDGKCWFREYFACYKSETRKVFAWKDGCTSWSVDDGSQVIARRTPWKYAKLAEVE